MIQERRYDIDWLRVLTIGLLLFYHISIVFQPWGVLIGFIQSNESLQSVWTPMTMINIWRIPLLFFVSGMGVCFAIRKRNWKQLLGERTKRIFIPLLFGTFVIVPINQYIFTQYYQEEFIYIPNNGHLWFLANIFIYVLVLTPVFYFLKSKKNGRFVSIVKIIFNKPLFLLVAVLIPFILEVLIIQPDIFEAYAMSSHGFWLGFLAFFFGFLFILTESSFWRTVNKWWRLFLTVALALYFIRFLFFELEAPAVLMVTESVCWIFAIFGIGFKWLNHPSKLLRYFSNAAYPIYIVHMIFLYLGSFWILPLIIPVSLKFTLLVLFTFSGCFLSYELVIKRIKYIRPLFGLKINESDKSNFLKVKTLRKQA